MPYELYYEVHRNFRYKSAFFDIHATLKRVPRNNRLSTHGPSSDAILVSWRLNACCQRIVTHYSIYSISSI